MVVVILFYTKLYTLYKRGKVMEEHENLNNQDEVNEEKIHENIEETKEENSSEEVKKEPVKEEIKQEEKTEYKKVKHVEKIILKK